MSLFSLATQDKASWAVKLDGNLEEISGNGLTSSTCTITGAPTFELSSATAGLGSHLFNQDPGQEMVYFTGTRSSSLSGFPVFETVVKIGTPPVLTTVNDRIIVRGETTDGFGSRTLGVRIQANGTISNPFFTAANSGTTTFQVISNININDGQWHHLMAIESLVNNNTKLDLYVDGVLSASGTAAQNIERAQPNNLRIGSRSTGTTFGFYGLIDFAAVYNQGYLSTPTFDSARVTAHYNNFLSTRDTYVIPSTLSYDTQIGSLNPKIWYKFNETAGTPVNSGSLSTTSTFNNLLQNEQTDVDGRAVYLNGTNARIQLPAHPAFSLFNDRSFTVECWVQINNADTNTTGPFEIFRLNPASSPHNTISLTIGGTSGNRGKVLLTSSWTTQLTSTNTIDDGTWHHIVYTYNTSSVKLYIDGVLDVSTTPTGLPASFVYDESTKKLIGAGYVGTAQTTIAQYLKARIDEFAAYDYELTAQNIIYNYNAGASVEFASGVLGTASALMVDPTLTVDYIETHAPMTADASFPLPNQTSYPEMLVAKMETYNLEGWLKFDNNEYNYGTGGTIRGLFVDGSAAIGLPGVCGMYAGRSSSSFFDGAISLDDPDNNIISKINDKVFSLGVWFKIPSTAGTSNKRVFHMAGSNLTARIEIFVDTNGYIQFQYRTSAGANNYTGSTNLKDDTWHYAAMRVDNSDVRYYLDGVEVSALTVTGTKSTPFVLGFFNIPADGSGDTSPYYVSNFYVAGHTEIDATDIAEIWDVGNQTLPIQAYAEMPQSSVRFNNAYNYKVEDLQANIDLRYDNATGNTPNLGLAGILNYGEFNFNLGTFQGTKLNPTKNRYAYYIDDKDDAINISSPFDASDNTNTYNLFARFNTLTTGEQWYAQIGDSFDPNLFSGYVIGADSDGPFFMGVDDTSDNSTWTTYHTNDTTLFDSYHLYTIVRDGSTAKFYIDGKLFDTYTPTGDDNVNGINLNAKDYMNLSGWDTSATTHTYQGWYLDEFQTFDYALSAQEVFELWQSLEIDNADDVSSTFVMPTLEAGFGPTLSVDEATASAELVNPVSSAETNELAIPMDAFAEFILPNFGGNVVIDANYGHTAATASALFHDPQLQIGDFHGADHMDASALFVHPISTGGGRITVSTAVGGPATFVMPGIVTIKGARVFADPMRSQAIFPLPPAYVTLTDDNWYLRLLQGHADKKIESVQQNLTNLPNQTTTDVVKGGFLSFFDDVLLDITPTTAINSISSEIPAHYFDRPGSYKYDTNGDLLPLNTTKAVSRASAPRASTNPTPMMSVGYFDDQERKAVRVENIEFVLPETGINFSERPYNLEFSFKTTKANQIIAYGQWNSFLYYGRKIGAIGLFDGKIYLAEDKYTVWSGAGSASLGDYRRNVASSAPHPKNFTNEYYVGHLLGRKRIDDGQWHHVVIQKGWTDNRTQIWIDGQLDRQTGVASELGSSTIRASKGLDGTNSIRPYIIGFNSTDPNLYSDFQTSAWNFYPGRFIEERDLNLNYSAYSKWEPIQPEPMEATIRLTDNNKGKGNRPRAVMLYWWETKPDGSQQHRRFDGDPLYRLDTDTFAQLKTQYNEKEEIQKYYGWDIFPIDILGRYQNPLIKEDVIVSAGYRDPVTGSPRYLDIVNDLDLSTIDAIFFRNYPDDTAELDEFAREEIADSYFGLKEKTLYENFINSLRSAMDLGINVYITNHQLAADLGIIENPEIVYDLLDEDTKQADPRSYDQQPVANALDNKHFDQYGSSLFRGWYDTYKNNYIKVINEVPGITDQYGIVRDAVQMWNPSAEDWSLPFRSFSAYTQKQNLNVGDTFVMSYATYTPFNTKPMSIEGYYAVHKDNVKAGIPITTFADTYWKGNVETENPYKDYVTSIALPPGTILNGRAIKSRVFVNFTERIAGSFEEGSVELIQDEWIDLAFQVGKITSTKRDQLKAAANNLDRRLETAIADNNQVLINAIQKLKYWDMNGMNMASSSRVVQGDISDQSANSGGASGTTATAATSTRGTIAPQPDNPTAGPNWGGGLWFKFDFYWQNEMMRIPVSTMLTRGFVWLSNRIIDDGTVNRTNVTTASATMVMPAIVGDKDRTVYAQAALSNANIIHAQGYSLTNVSNSTLPFLVEAKFGEFVKNIKPDVMAAEARFRSDILTTAVETDQVVVYVYHVDPIVYLREEVIK